MYRNKIKSMHFLLSACLLLLFSFPSCSQSTSVKIEVEDHPGGKVKLVRFDGDRMVSVKDKTYQNGVGFNMEDQELGMYRIIIKEAKSRRERPKAVNFIYNGEDIKLHTSYKSPKEDLEVISSRENEIYHDFLSYHRTFEQKMDLLNGMIDQYPKSDPFYDKVMNK